MSRAAAKAQTLAKLREAGRDVLLEVGVQQAMIQDITSRAGVAVGTFYMHFASKSELVDSLVDDLNQGMAQQILAVFMVVPLPPARTLIDNLAKVVVAYWADNAHQLPLLADHVARHPNDEVLRVGANGPVVVMIRAIAFAVPNLQLKTTPEFFVTALISMWRAVGRLAATLDPPGRDAVARDVAKATKQMFETFTPGLLDQDATQLVATAFAAMKPGG